MWNEVAASSAANSRQLTSTPPVVGTCAGSHPGQPATSAPGRRMCGFAVTRADDWDVRASGHREPAMGKGWLGSPINAGAPAHRAARWMLPELTG